MSEMRYGKIPNVDKKVSRIIFGTASEPFLKGEDENCLLDAVYDQGVNTFDTARVYGLSERSLGSWMAERGIRNQVVILSKCAHPDVPSWRKRINEKEIREDLEKSLRLLRTDYIDIYLLHRDDPEIEAGQREIVRYLSGELTGRERIRLFGVPRRTQDKIGLFSFTVEGAHHEDLALILDKMGIAVRSGQMCAEPLMDHLGVTGMVRVSFAPYNTMEEAEYFVKCLDKAIAMLI